MGRPTSESAPLVLTPVLRPATVVGVSAAAGPALMIVGQWMQITRASHSGVHAIGAVLVFLGAVLVVACGRALLITRRGFVQAWPDGFYNRLVGARAQVTWEQVDRFEVIPRLTGRVVQAVNQDGSRITLAAPRTGLFAQATSFDQSLRELSASPGGHRPSVLIEHRARYLALLHSILFLAAATIVTLIALT